MKKLLAAFTTLVAVAVAGCSFLEREEAVKKESSRTVYRAAEAPPDLPEPVSVQQEVPGEKRSKLF